MAHKLPELGYSYDALEPHIDARTMEIHPTKHHATYVAKLNEALDKNPELHEKCPTCLLKDLSKIPEDIRGAVRNHGGGHVNHSMFWPSLSPDGGGAPSGALGEAMDSNFGSFESFKETFSQSAVGLFGSGWVWLCAGSEGELSVTTTPNQDNPVSMGSYPIFGLDVWEHAYYLKYENRRADYVEAWWNIVNWKRAANSYNLIQIGEGIGQVVGWAQDTWKSIQDSWKDLTQ